MRTVLVLMSSYNGEKFIEEQIDSILNQRGVNVNLLIRDDGSKDSTPAILEGYKKRGLLDYYIGENIGWRASFMDLVSKAPQSEYYAFSDQDDHWKDNKLRVGVETLEAKPSGPKLYMSNVIYWKDGEEKGLSMPLEIRTDLYYTSLFCDAFGCTMVFNKELMDIVKANQPKIIVAHDVWFYELAAVLGVLYYDGSSYIQYRQHDNNQLGYDKYFWEKFSRRIKSYSRIWGVHNKDLVSQELLKCYGHLITPDNKEILSVVANYRSSLRCYFRLLFSKQFFHKEFLTNVGLKFRVLIRHI